MSMAGNVSVAMMNGKAASPSLAIRKAGAYSLSKKADAALRAVLEGRSPGYAIAEEGIFGGYDLPPRTEAAYANRISAHRGNDGIAGPMTLNRLITNYMFAGIEYRRVRFALGRGIPCEDDPRFMLSNYRELDKLAGLNPRLFPPKRAMHFLGRIAGYADELLGMGIAIPEREDRSLRAILSAHAARFGTESCERPEQDAERLVWAVLPYEREEYTAARRMKAFMRALIRLHNPHLEVAMEGFFGEYELDSRARARYYSRITRGYLGKKDSDDWKRDSDDLGQLLFSMQSYELLYAFKRLSPTPIGDGMSSLAMQIADVLGRNASLLGPRLSAALMRKVAGLAENILHEADAVPGGSHGQGDMELAKIISGIRCRE